MMMQTPPPSLQTRDSVLEEMRIPSRKEKESLLRMYARKLGLNDRGCYVSAAIAIIAFFLLVTIIAMAACWPATHLRYSGSIGVCSSSACLAASSSLVSSMNMSVSACDNPWVHACGHWDVTHPLPQTRSSWSVILEMEQKTLKEKARLVASFAHKPSQYNSIEWKIQHFYESCKSLEYIESDKEKPLMKIIKSLGGWEVLRSFNLYNWDPHRVLRELHSEFGVPAFFTVGVVPDPTNPGTNTVVLGPGGLGMPDRTYYHRFPNDSSVQAYQTFMKDAAQLFGAPSPEAHKFAVDIFNFEKRIAEITPDREYLEDPRKVNNKMKVRELRTMSINIPWLEVLKSCYPNGQISEETSVLVMSPQYAADIAVIMSTTDRGSLNNYLIWQLVHRFLPYLSSTFTEVVTLYRKLLTGAHKPLPRWEMCARTTNTFFGHLMDSLYYKEKSQSFLPEEDRVREVKRMFGAVREALAARIAASSELDYRSRMAASEKLKAMDVQVGTPDILRDTKFLKILYKDFSVQKQDFFQNILYGVTFLRKKEEHYLMSPGEETRWLPSLLSTKVEYVPAANLVVVPEYLLQPPVFQPLYPAYLNLGGLGAMLGSAAVEGSLGRGAVFTVEGRLLGGGGREGNNNTMYNERMGGGGGPLDRWSSCLTSQWGNTGLDTPDMLHRSRQDSVLQLAGLQVALSALTTSLSLEGSSLLPTLESMDPQAVLLLQHSRLQCGVQSLQDRDLQRTVVPRLPAREGLLGRLAQTRDFYHFYFCEEVVEESLCQGL